jgi:hypothetical protein
VTQARVGSPQATRPAKERICANGSQRSVGAISEPACQHVEEARSRRDEARLAALTAADARWESPTAGTTVGRDAVLENVQEAYEETDRFDSEILAIECRGDRAVVILQAATRPHHDPRDEGVGTVRPDGASRAHGLYPGGATAACRRSVQTFRYGDVGQSEGVLNPAPLK